MLAGGRKTFWLLFVLYAVFCRNIHVMAFVHRRLKELKDRVVELIAEADQEVSTLRTMLERESYENSATYSLLDTLGRENPENEDSIQYLKDLLTSTQQFLDPFFEQKVTYASHLKRRFLETKTLISQNELPLTSPTYIYYERFFGFFKPFLAMARKLAGLFILPVLTILYVNFFLRNV